MSVHTRLMATTLAAMAALAFSVPAAQAATDPPSASMAAEAAHDQKVAAATKSPCVAGGPTAADTASADRLNVVLQGKLKNAMSAYRVSCARAVINAVQQRGLDERAAVIAITTTIVESTIENIN